MSLLVIENENVPQEIKKFKNTILDIFFLKKWIEMINFSGTNQDVEHLNKLKQ